MKTTTVQGAVFLFAAATVAACGSGAKSGIGANAPVVTGVCRVASNAKPIGRSGAGSTVALARVGERRVMFVADEDAKAILTMDLDTQQSLAETVLGATPGQVYVGNDGRVIVTLRDKNEVAAFSATRADAPLVRACSIPTAVEPIALAATNDDATIFVTSGWGRKLTVLESATFAQITSLDLPREPRAVVVADDGKSVFVSHAVGSLMTTVDLASHEVKSIDLHMDQGTVPSEGDEQERRHPSCQGFALAKSSAVRGRIFAPQVLVDPGDFEQRPDGYGDDNTPTESPDVAVVDEAAKSPLTSSLHAASELSSRQSSDPRDVQPECLLPRAAVVDPQTKSLLVTCYGIDAVIAYDARAARPINAERRRWIVGSGPSGIAVDVEKHRAVVWSQFDRTVSTFPIGDTDLTDDKVMQHSLHKTAAAPMKDKIPTEYALGRILFHAAGDARVSADGRACASCHPDGRDDAITWATPEGPRRSIMLAGRATRTAPYSWNGNEVTLHNHLGNTFDRLSGRGLRSIELDALVTYIAQMPAPPPLVADKAKIDRGRQIFASKEAACATCHAGSDYTDGKNHDVLSKHKADRGNEFNTPSLHLVGGTGPYFHDGRYATLGDVLHNADGMGNTKHLTTADFDALEAYVRSL